jgi:integrase
MLESQGWSGGSRNGIARGRLDEYTINGRRSKEDLERRINLHLKPVFTGRTLASITGADAIEFSAQRVKAGASNAEVNRELATLKRIFRLALQCERYHGRVPLIAMLKESAPRAGFFDDEMMDAVIAGLVIYLRPVVRVAYITGRVESEVLPLEWRQVDLKMSATMPS